MKTKTLTKKLYPDYVTFLTPFSAFLTGEAIAYGADLSIGHFELTETGYRQILVCIQRDKDSRTCSRPQAVAGFVTPPPITPHFVNLFGHPGLTVHLMSRDEMGVQGGICLGDTSVVKVVVLDDALVAMVLSDTAEQAPVAMIELAKLDYLRTYFKDTPQMAVSSERPPKVCAPKVCAPKYRTDDPETEDEPEKADANNTKDEKEFSDALEGAILEAATDLTSDIVDRALEVTRTCVRNRKRTYSASEAYPVITDKCPKEEAVNILAFHLDIFMKLRAIGFATKYILDHSSADHTYFASVLELIASSFAGVFKLPAREADIGDIADPDTRDAAVVASAIEDFKENEEDDSAWCFADIVGQDEEDTRNE